MTATTLPPGERIATLDIVRGIAVMGIFSVNVIAFAMHEAAYFNPSVYGGHSGIDLALWVANLIMVDGKMRTLFSMLFGASMLLVIDRAEMGGQDGWRVHWRRMAVLLAIGLFHYFAIWRGDILTLYAVAGFILYRFRHFETRRLVRWGIALTLFGMALFALASLGLYAEQADASANPLAPSTAEIAADKALHLGPWSGLTGHKLGDFGMLVGMTLFFLPETLGLMLFGMAAFRSGMLTGAWSRDGYRHLALWGIAIGLASHVVLAWVDIASGFSMPVMFAGFGAAVVPFRIVQALGYAALIILLARPGGWLTERIAAVGRAAFTNYLGTSIIAAAVFYGWGGGLYGSASRAEAWLLVPLVWLVMLAWSRPWLDRYRYGPLEWLWRSLSRGAFQPMRRLPSPA